MVKVFFCVCVPWHNSPSGSKPPHYRGFTITLRRTTVGTTPLDEWTVRGRDLWQHTTLITDRHPCPLRDSNTKSQQASGYWDRRWVNTWLKSVQYISTQLLVSVSLCGYYYLCYNLKCTKWILNESRIGCYAGLEGSLDCIAPCHMIVWQRREV